MLLAGTPRARAGKGCLELLRSRRRQLGSAPANRYALLDATVFGPLKADPHLEMHTRGG